MLERIHLENFKASRDVDIRLSRLSVLAGLNSSGKSTLLQAVGALRQSYEPSGRTEGLSLSGQLVQLGKFGDLLTEGSTDDFVAIAITEDGVDNRWVFGGRSDANQLDFSDRPFVTPRFLTSTRFQYLQADRIVPRTLYPQAPQRARDAGFLGPQGEYTPDYLSMAAKLPVSVVRRFPRVGIGITGDLLDKVAPTDSLLDQVTGWLQQLSPGTRLDALALTGTDEVLLRYSYAGRLKEVTTNYYRPTNVGFGLTYSLPIIVACLAAPSGALLLLENPEAHLHPQGQTALGELIARCASDGVQIIAETHSDHLLNGVRLAVKRNQVNNADVVLHYFSRSVESGEASVQSPSILANGRLSNWPKGFFDQWDRDVEALLD
jgi:predicted ATPase